MKDRGWDKAQVKTFVANAIEVYQSSWNVVPSIRRAIVAHAFALVVTGLDRKTIPTIYLENLWADMCEQAEKWGMPA